MGAFISIIIPVYNVEEYLVECLDSVANQIVPFDEVIIINDGSTDRSSEICEKYISTYAYFRLISQDNRGLSAARNRGICEISGEYVMFLDSDDYLKPDTVEVLKKKIGKTSYDAIFFDAEIFSDGTVSADTKNIYDRSLAGLDGKEMSGEEYFAKCYPQNYVVNVGMGIYKTQLIKEKNICFPEGLYYEDNYFSFAFLEYAKMVIHISEKLHFRRYRANSITISEYSEKKLNDHIQIGLLIWNEMIKRRDILSLKIKEMFLKYASDYYCMVLDRYQYCNASHVLLSENIKSDLKTMAKRYGTLLKVLHIKRVNTNLILFNQIMMGIHRTNLFIGVNFDEENILIQDIVKKQKHIYYLLLREIPFNIPGFKIGIYGTGNHTKGLLAIYKKLFGEITCDLFYLDSYKSKERIWGKELINYREIDYSTDLIVLSSFVYEQEMLDNIRSVIYKVPVYRFYNDIKEDIFSSYESFLQYW